jgi:hypothetical protein
MKASALIPMSWYDGIVCLGPGIVISTGTSAFTR